MLLTPSPDTEEGVEREGVILPSPLRRRAPRMRHPARFAEPIIQDDQLCTVPGVRNGQKIDHSIMEEWMQLLQISSDDEPGMLWSDRGSLYYCIRKDDLIGRHFDDAICIEQSY